MSDRPLVPDVLPKSARCRVCDGVGWVDVPVVSGAEAVARCPSCAPKPGTHDGACTCLDCSYGSFRARKIRSGEDGIERDPGQADPLAVAYPRTEAV